MTLKLRGRITSINVRKVVFTAQLLELPFERIDAGAVQRGLLPVPPALRVEALRRWYDSLLKLPAACGALDLPLG